ncbi:MULTISPECIES: protein TolR [Idiomarina]|jgi:biopolymer transport protein TolR|uniref:Tol-Pal system protein TolR n=2 Tax=Idiomarina TaxID=135575 RepID=A0A241R4R7_9GAMM|nr:MULTISPECIES: protein TolR [Idiomarina]KTG24145.1 protein TolR [Idiomarina sp. H105]MBF38031.1 protein TolR [Idiomarinaceae bacterium]OAE91536.1 protein TolR [Idiomarina sp. WRN-38]ASG66231.1 protein TolR [Idiomarina piscisalsi]KPD24679.1 biopolymer transporter ExbD [Idiomarina zobellii]|tara:strand:+ start:78 stop:506 length:429 start_codon:yes stop_codon:yes gene_type:complete
MMVMPRKRRKPVAEINVVPYIDVMLVLLIIFMVTAPLITQGVKVDLPKATAEPLSEDSKPPLVASVDAEGRYYLNQGDSQDTPMQADELATLVAAHLQVEPDTPVMVNGDGAVSYNQIVQLMVLLQRAGVPSVGLMTDSSEE